MPRRVYRRTDTAHDRRRRPAAQPHVRVEDVLTGEVDQRSRSPKTPPSGLGVHRDAAAHRAADRGAPRASQLSIRQYQRPNGEVIGLLVDRPVQDRPRTRHPDVGRAVPRHRRHHPTPHPPTGASSRWSRRYDTHEQVASDAACRSCSSAAIGQRHEVITTTPCATCSAHLRQSWPTTHPEFASVRFTPHDFRRLFATDLVNNGLPIHIGAALLGHLNLETTRGYVAVFDEDIVRHYQAFLARRRALRPADEYRPVTDRGMDRVRGALRQTQGRARQLRPALRHALRPRARLHPLPDAARRPEDAAASDEIETDLQ